MPMFYTPKPRQFHYEPRFYDPKKEKWEALKKKYAAEHDAQPSADCAASAEESAPEAADDDLRYFQERVRTLDRRQRQPQMGLMDLFRRREMPKWNYQPRFQGDAAPDEAPAQQASSTAQASDSPYKVRIRRRYDITSTDYMKPIAPGRIMLYGLLVAMLLFWILG